MRQSACLDSDSSSSSSSEMYLNSSILAFVLFEFELVVVGQRIRAESWLVLFSCSDVSSVCLFERHKLSSFSVKTRWLCAFNRSFHWRFDLWQTHRICGRKRCFLLFLLFIWIKLLKQELLCDLCAEMKPLPRSGSSGATCRWPSVSVLSSQ